MERVGIYVFDSHIDGESLDGIHGSNRLIALLADIDDCLRAILVTLQIRLNAVVSNALLVCRAAKSDGIELRWLDRHPARKAGEREVHDVLPREQLDVWHVANFIKHADGWAGMPTKPSERYTVEAVVRLGLVDRQMPSRSLNPWFAGAAAVKLSNARSLGEAVQTILSRTFGWCAATEADLRLDFEPLREQIEAARKKHPPAPWP